VTGLLAGWALVRLTRPAFDAADGLGFPENWRNHYPGWPFTVPWAVVAVLMLGVPLLAIAIGYLTTRSRLPLIRRLGQ